MAILLFLFWLLLNERITIEIILIGATLSVALTFTAHRVLRISRRGEFLFWRRLPRILSYLLYLTGQIILSNLQVIHLILKPTADRPKLVWFRPKNKSNTGRLALANSITLTPGTVTTALRDDMICVYALRPEFAEGLQDSDFSKKLCRLEETDHG